VKAHQRGGGYVTASGTLLADMTSNPSAEMQGRASG
jgi:Mn-containing catalase